MVSIGEEVIHQYGLSKNADLCDVMVLWWGGGALGGAAAEVPASNEALLDIRTTMDMESYNTSTVRNPAM
jgi:hypothetical protein